MQRAQPSAVVVLSKNIVGGVLCAEPLFPELVCSVGTRAVIVYRTSARARVIAASPVSASAFGNRTVPLPTMFPENVCGPVKIAPSQVPVPTVSAPVELVGSVTHAPPV